MEINLKSDINREDSGFRFLAGRLLQIINTLADWVITDCTVYVQYITLVLLYCILYIKEGTTQQIFVRLLRLLLDKSSRHSISTQYYMSM